MWLDAEEAVATSQSYTIAGRSLTRANLAEIGKRIAYYRAEVAALESGRGAGMRVQRVMPRDV
jgi:hypothetical protein